MKATDNPRMNLCAACVQARGLEAGDAFVRIAEDMPIRGACHDCGGFLDLEAWRAKDAPPAAETLRALPDDEPEPPRVVRPFKSRVVIKPDDRAERTKGGIIIPETAREGDKAGEPTRTGTVLRTGDDVKELAAHAWVLYYERPALEALDRDAGPVHVIDEGDVLAVLAVSSP